MKLRRRCLGLTPAQRSWLHKWETIQHGDNIHDPTKAEIMTIFFRAETYTAISVIFSLVTLGLIYKLLRRVAFNLGAAFAAAGFVLSMCLSGFLVATYTINNKNYIDLRTIGKRTEGTIVGMDHFDSHARGGHSNDCPIVQYVPSDGIPRVIYVRESHCSDSVDSSKLPRHVPVTYLETRPDVAKVLEWQPAVSSRVSLIGFFCAAWAVFFLWLFSALL